MHEDKYIDIPLVSVVITCYNYGEYVRDSIESVLNQTYKNIELIVINDGSTDNSLDVICAKAEKHNFRIINQSNQGIIKTRNVAIREAGGEYVIQLDADDTIPRDYVEKLMVGAIVSKADICYAPAINLITKKTVIFPQEFNLEKLKIHNFIHTSALIKASVIKKYEYDKYLDNLGYEDWDIYLTMCLGGARAILIPDTALNYRIHNSRKSRSDLLNNTIGQLDANIYILQKHINLYPEAMEHLSLVSEWLIMIRSLKLENIELSRENNIFRKKIQKITRNPLYKIYRNVHKIVNQRSS